MQLSYDGHLFYLKCDVVDNRLAKRLGFAWDKTKKVWATPFPEIAMRARRYGDDKTKDLLKLMHSKAQTKRALSSYAGKKGTFSFPVPIGCELLPYQEIGVKFIVDNKNTLLADEMGLGKTIQAIAACNVIKPKNVLIICPASAKNVWLKEWAIWSTLGLSVVEVKGKSGWPKPMADVVIINYDVLASHSGRLKEFEWDMVIVDEAHRLKNPKTKRTKQVIGGRAFYTKADGSRGYQVISPIKAKRKIGITGTPIENKTIDLYPILKFLSPEGFPNWRDFGLRYCGAKKGYAGWEFKGSSNLDELQRKLRSTIMIRRLKSDVLKELPPKIRQIIEIDPDSKAKKLLKANDELVEKYNGDYNALVSGLGASAKAEFLLVSKMRLELAQFIYPHVVAHLESLIEAGEKVIVFGHHVDEMIKPLLKHFGSKAVGVYGATSNKNRKLAEDKFQNSKDVKLFIGNIQAASEAITLTAASVVVFAEGSWKPSQLSQAEDRAHRYGKKDTVLVQHLVVSGTIGSTMIRYAVDKQNTSDKALNNDSEKFLEEMLA